MKILIRSMCTGIIFGIPSNLPNWCWRVLHVSRKNLSCLVAWPRFVYFPLKKSWNKNYKGALLTQWILVMLVVGHYSYISGSVTEWLKHVSVCWETSGKYKKKSRLCDNCVELHTSHVDETWLSSFNKQLCWASVGSLSIRKFLGLVMWKYKLPFSWTTPCSCVMQKCKIFSLCKIPRRKHVYSRD